MPQNAQASSHQRAILLLPGAVDFTHIQRYYPDWLIDSLVIAVDKGIDKAMHFPNGVDLWVGDFDSSEGLVVDAAHYGEKIPYPVDKDEIDTELAIGMAIARGVSEILILGGIGGRIDHQMALLFLPVQYPEVQFQHTNGAHRMQYLHAGENYKMPALFESLVSVIALTDLKGLTLSGVKWPLSDYTLPLGRGLTYSNRALEETVSVVIEMGSAWLYICEPEIDDSL